MSNHDRFCELLALRLYGETDDAEAQELREHLRACESCAAFALELEGGLGALLRSRSEDSAAAGAAPPVGWRDAMDDELAAHRRRGMRVQPLAAFVAGLAAGLAILVLRSGAEPSPPPAELDSALASGSTETFATNALEEPLVLAGVVAPQPADGRGAYGMLGELLRLR